MFKEYTEENASMELTMGRGCNKHRRLGILVHMAKKAIKS